jgi:hypothetical protein
MAPGYSMLPGGEVANTPIALVIAGSGETTPDEVADLLNDAYPEDKYDVDLFFPVDKDLFTGTVETVVGWLDNDEYVYPVKTKGASMSRKSSRFADPTEVNSFTDIFDPDEFKDWEDVHFLVAIPEDDESDEYETYAELVEVAVEKGFTVKNLCAGLDDVVLAEPEAEEPEPEPEPEKPARKRRGRSEEKAEEPEPEKGLQQEVNAAAAEVRKAPQEPAALSQDIADALSAVKDAERALRRWQEAAELISGQSVEHTLVARLDSAYNVLVEAVRPGGPGEPSEAPSEAETDAEAPRRGRGRPRTNFEVKQILDDDSEEWIPRPKGRLRKGTQWRTIHAETDEVLEQGTA